MKFLLDPFTWMGAGAGLIVGIATALCVCWLYPDRSRRLIYATSMMGTLILGVTLSQWYEASMMAKIAASMAASPPTESLVATATELEFRSIKYLSKDELVDALRVSSPKPERVSVSWFASGNNSAERQAAAANAELAVAAAEEAGIQVSRGVIGVESFDAVGIKASTPQ